MHIDCFTHVPFEGPGAIAAWAAARGHDLRVHRLWVDGVPDTDGALVVMGGPMSVGDAATHPWLPAERAAIRTAIAAGRPVLGICLGAQQIAAALGAAVTPMPGPEIGWFPLERVADDPLARTLDTGARALHWHGEACAVPEGAQRLWCSARCATQGFRYGARVVGLQFHLEAGAEAVDALIAHGGDDLTARPGVQAPAALRAGAQRYAADARRALDTLLGRWAAA